MASYKYLLFFNKNGDSINLDYNEDLDMWEGRMFFPRVAVDLHENEHLFILEGAIAPTTAILYDDDCFIDSGSGPLLYDDSTNDDVATFPLLGNYDDPYKSAFCARWETNESRDEIFMYEVEEENDVPFITRYETLEWSAVPTVYELDDDGKKIICSANSSALKVNLAFMAKSEDIYERVLILEDCSYETPKIIAKIRMYGESVGEDERFRLMLENFGRRLDHRDALMLRDYDIKESLPDWELINEKRKELLMAGEDIFPYMGSYRGLVNIIKFFGYQDLRIKEYWLNVDKASEYYGKINQVQINGLLTDTNSPFLKHPMIPTTTYRKKGEFGLFYDITKETGAVDQYGIPVTENSSQFTMEEVLIKLFSLKEKLQRDYMPVNAKIVDIVGEGIYFERYGIRTWTDPLRVIPMQLGIDVDFATDPADGYVKDLRRFKVKQYPGGLDLPEDRFTNLVNPYTLGQAYPPHAVPGLIESIEAYYEEINRWSSYPYEDERSAYYGDEPILDDPNSAYYLNSTPDSSLTKIVAGCPMVLSARIEQFSWDDLTAQSWDDMSLYTWDNIDYSNFYDIRWTIEKGGTNPYYFQHQGSIQTYRRLPHFLPFAGEYTVTMEIFDMYNNRSIEVRKVSVQSHELEIGAFARWRDYETYTWDSTDNTWDDFGGSTWHFPIEGISLFNSPLHDTVVNMARYRNQELAQILNTSTGQYEYYLQSTDPSAQRFGTFTLDWDGMDAPWDEFYHTTWDMWEYHSEKLGGFKIYSPEIGDGIQIDDWPVFYFEDLSPSISPLDLQEAVDQLNASSNPGIQKFNYHVYQGPSSPPYIQASGKFPGPDSWRFVTYYPSMGSGLSGDEYSWKYPTWLLHQSALQDVLTRYPSINEDMLFLDAPLDDLIADTVGNVAYWQSAGYLKTELPSAEYPLGERRGHLPSSAGSGSFNNGDLRVFKNDFTAPIGVPLFFVHNQSEIPGKQKARWRVTNSITGEPFIDVKSYYLIVNFLEESRYDVECWLEDSNGNESYTIRHGLVRIADRQSMYGGKIKI